MTVAGFIDKLDLTFTEWVTKRMPITGLNGVPDATQSPLGLFNYLDGRRKAVIAGAKLRPLIRLADKDLNILAEIEGEIEGDTDELLHDTGKLTLSILYDNWIADWMIHHTQEVEDLHILVDDPVNPDWRTRWGGKIIELHMKRDEKGIHTIQIIALHHREHAKRLLVAANPIFAPEIQLPKMWVMPGPCRTAIALTMFLNLGRIFMPIWSTIDNALNPAAWFSPLGADTLLNFLPTAWPLQVAFVDPALDQSRWTVIGGSWTDWHNVFKDVLIDSGCVLRAYTYLTTDADSPNGELADILRAAPDMIGELTGIDVSGIDTTIDKLVAPTRNCVVFAVEQKDGRTGATGTVADGIFNTVAVTLDDLISPIVVNLTNGAVIDAGQVLNGERIEDATGLDQTYLIESLTGAAPAPPQVIWWQDDYSGPISTDLTFHKGSVKKIVTGGKSPVLVNEAQTFGIKYGLSQIQTTIAAGWGYNEGPAPIGAGLDSIYQGQLDNCLLAYETFTDPIRALYAGDLSWQEHLEKGTGTAYTLATVLTLRSGNFKTRPFAAFKAQVLNGHPWIVDKDYFLGDRVGFEHEGIIYVDQVYSIKRQWSRTKPLNILVSIGEDRMKSDPFGLAFKTMAGIWAGVGALTGQSTIF